VIASDPEHPQDSLRGRQLAVYEALLEVDGDVAAIYVGSVVVARSSNPDRFALASHGMRELLERLPIASEVKPVGETSLKSLVGNLRNDWSRAVTNSDCTEDGQDWAGEIDGALSRLLRRVREFLDESGDLRPPRRKRAEQFVRDTDPFPSGLPDRVAEHRVGRWQILRDYFTRMSHHSEAVEDFDGFAAEAETFLLDHLRPRTYEDRSELLAIIEEGEKDG